ncbi:MAG: ribosome silencing factor [Candidatus Caldatribacterium sp.]|uniref:ribosome silencing factor n=1 Tax=Candidatus Caldatribacterium sp. TaxID=2282143 RepID=UPI002998DE79|nr:ribosome silencing factor [Candidatus Caldatribacterium sp.]MCX7731321.1 ribosome silencing factor [Candidatus Caldatribacterium sp.]MDW8080705.1 ribosome silencing factor [Candidatus Calescibacterium sp.]
MRIQEVIRKAKEAIEKKKAFDVTVLDLRGLFPFSDYWVLCSGSSPLQTKAVAEEILKVLEEMGLRPFHVEGEDTGEWILIDYGDVIVHVFRQEEREFYNLEKLWQRARVVYSERDGLDLLDEID